MSGGPIRAAADNISLALLAPLSVCLVLLYVGEWPWALLTVVYAVVVLWLVRDLIAGKPRGGPPDEEE